MADDTQLIASEPLNFTKYTAWAGSAGLAAVATFTAIKTGLGDLDPRVQVGLLLLAGAFAIAVAISGAADALARAYATAHMKPDAR